MGYFPPPQTSMGILCTVMGGACMVMPETLARLSFKREALPKDGGEAQPMVKLLTRCFGAQAVMCGILLLTTRMDKRAHAIWAGALVPFFVFDYAAWRAGLLTPFGALGDLAGNCVFLACSAVGAGWLRLTAA